MCVIANVSSGKLVFGAQCLMAGSLMYQSLKRSHLLCAKTESNLIKIANNSNIGTDFVQIDYLTNHKIKMRNAVQFRQGN